MRDILVTGGAGQIGLELARLRWPADVGLHFPTRADLDIGSEASIETHLADKAFAAIINTAAYTSVDKAEVEADEAFRVNASGPGWLAEAARRAGIPLIHLSTDYVFDGSGTEPRREDDAVAPLGVYGASKLAGEQAAMAGNPRSLVLRTAWLVSAHRGNFLNTMLRLARDNVEVRVIDDQWGNPTSAGDVAAALQVIVLRMIDDPAAPTGVFHFVNAGGASWYGLAQEIFAASAAEGGPSATAVPITTADYPAAARRPAYSRLATGKIEAQYGIQPRDWRLAVRDIVGELAGGRPCAGD